MNTFFYPTENEYNSIEDPHSLNLSTFSNFAQLVDSLEVLKEGRQNVVSKIEDKNNLYHFEVYTIHNGNMIPIHVKYKNIISISPDSIFKNKLYSIDSLDYLLKKDLLNFGKDLNFSDSPDRLIVSIEFPENGNINDVKDLMIKVFNSYNKLENKIKDTVNLNIFLNWKTEIIKPPPVPTEIKNEN